MSVAAGPRGSDVVAELVELADDAAARHVDVIGLIGAGGGSRADDRAGRKADTDATPAPALRLGFAGGHNGGGAEGESGQQSRGDLGLHGCLPCELVDGRLGLDTVWSLEPGSRFK